MPDTRRISTGPAIRLAELAIRGLQRVDSKLEKIPLFWHPIWLAARTPPVHRYLTYEYEWPYRSANSFVIRYGWRRGLVVGWWRGGGLDEESGEYEDHLMHAVQGHEDVTNERFRKIADLITWEGAAGEEAPVLDGADS